MASSYHDNMMGEDDDMFSQGSQNSDESSVGDIDPLAINTDTLTLALDDLEGRIITAINDFKEHPGVKSPGYTSIHAELEQVLRPLLEIAAHNGPAAARNHWRTTRPSVEKAMQEVYERLNSDLIFPVLRETALSEAMVKRAAALGFFHKLHVEYKSKGSYLDFVVMVNGQVKGSLYGVQLQQHRGHQIPPDVLRTRSRQTMQFGKELLTYWLTCSVECIQPGAFSNSQADGAIASRAVISASAVIRPALRLVSEKLKALEDSNAAKLFIMVMKMIEEVLKRLFTSQNDLVGPNISRAQIASADALKSACIKFLEIVVLCFSTRADPGRKRRNQRHSPLDDFALDDIPPGNVKIRREILEEIGEDAFTVLRGLTMLGGQVKVDANDKRLLLQQELLRFGGVGEDKTISVLTTLKSAAVAYLEIERRQMTAKVTKENPFFNFDRSTLDTEFDLNQKSFALTINAVSMLASKRPTFFQDSATCLARRTMDPPTAGDESSLAPSAIIAIQAQLKASCLTLLRNDMSITSRGSDILHKALSSEKYGMKIQADKAKFEAERNLKLKLGGRKARQEAAGFYQWESGDIGGVDGITDASHKRRMKGDTALERMRAAKRQRGLGNGIQLPTSTVDACELILVNLKHLPTSRASATSGERKAPAKKLSSEHRPKREIDLEYFVDAIMTNGASLESDETRWYGRDGGMAWKMDIAAVVSDDEEIDSNDSGNLKEKSSAPVTFTLDTKTMEAAKISMESAEKERTDESKLYSEQCRAASSDAFARIIQGSGSDRDNKISEFRNQIAARLAFTLKGVQPMGEFKDKHDITMEHLSVKAKQMKEKSEEKGKEISRLMSFAEEFPLVSSSIAYDIETQSQRQSTSDADGRLPNDTGTTLTNRLINEAYLDNRNSSDEKEGHRRYDNTLELYVSTVTQTGEKTDEKPLDSERKKVAAVAASSLPQHLAIAPHVTQTSLELTCAMCDIESITRKASEAATKVTNQNLATSAAYNAAKVAAEKRATGALLALRDAAFQRSRPSMRRMAVDCAVGIASGRLPASASVEDKALKLVVNVLYPKAAGLTDNVISAATKELEEAAKYSVDNLEKVKSANETEEEKGTQPNKNPLMPFSKEEKAAMEHVKKPANLFMALCLRRTKLIQTLMQICCRDGADILMKAVRNNMPKLARGMAKNKADKVALEVSSLASESETSLLLSFLDNLAPADGDLPSQDLIDACHTIQENRKKGDTFDSRFIIPVVSGIKREVLQIKLVEFIAVNDDIIFKAALRRMGERLVRYSCIFREETDKALVGMSLCEQIVFLHRLDFVKHNLPQKRYLQAINTCLDDDEVFTDRVIMAALDHISGTFLGGVPLPLGYMRTVILTCRKHENLHLWICNTLLPRLTEGGIYNDRRQWEGWMRCASMLENTGDSGVSSISAIQRLPEEQYGIYRSKNPQA